MINFNRFLPSLSVKSWCLNWGKDLIDSFEKTFIKADRWLQLLKALGVTLEITLFAAILGIVIGFFIAEIRSTYDKNIQGHKCRGFGD